MKTWTRERTQLMRDEANAMRGLAAQEMMRDAADAIEELAWKQISVGTGDGPVLGKIICNPSEIVP